MGNKYEIQHGNKTLYKCPECGLFYNDIETAATSRLQKHAIKLNHDQA